MNGIQIKEEIIRLFVHPNKRERFLLDLKSKKKSKDLIWKFHTPIVFDTRHAIPTKFLEPKELERKLRTLCSCETAFVWNEYGENSMPLNQACLCTLNGGIYILYCGDGVGYYQGEEGEKSSFPPRLILLRKK